MLDISLAATIVLMVSERIACSEREKLNNGAKAQLERRVKQSVLWTFCSQSPRVPLWHESGSALGATCIKGQAREEFVVNEKN